MVRTQVSTCTLCQINVPTQSLICKKIKKCRTWSRFDSSILSSASWLLMHSLWQTGFSVIWCWWWWFVAFMMMSSVRFIFEENGSILFRLTLSLSGRVGSSSAPWKWQNNDDESAQAYFCLTLLCFQDHSVHMSSGCTIFATLYTVDFLSPPQSSRSSSQQPTHIIPL